MFYSNWLDKTGGLHLSPTPHVEQSENAPMYTGLLATLEKVLCSNDYVYNYATMYLLAIMDLTAPSHFRPTSVTKKQTNGDYDMSHDNMTGIASLASIHGGRDGMLRYVPIFGRQRLHPRDVIYYGYLKYPWLFWWWLPVLSVIMVVSCIERYKTRDGFKILKTDGKLLTFMRCHTAGLTLTWWICDWIIKRKKKDFPFGWESVSKTYFKKIDHPINVLFARFEKERA